MCIISVGFEGPFFIYMRNYRLVLIFKSDIAKEAKEKVLADAKSWGGKLTDVKVLAMGEKKFAYAIKKALKGDYVLVEFKAERVEDELENKIRIHPDVLRHMLVRMD